MIRPKLRFGQNLLDTWSPLPPAPGCPGLKAAREAKGVGCASKQPFPPAWLPQIQVGTDPHPCPICARKAGAELSVKGAGSFTVVMELPPARGWPPPQLPSGWGPVGGKLPSATPASDWLRSAAVPATRLPLPAGAATSVVVANTAQSSGHSCASQRPASPTRSQTPQLHAPKPSPPACLASQAARSPRSLPPQAARPCPPAPSPSRPVPPLAKPSWGTQAPAQGHSHPQRGSSGRGRR